ncbi:MAG: leucine-rich repeat domain-containing protein, partial [Promethearchaeota archaeon]
MNFKFPINIKISKARSCHACNKKIDFNEFSYRNRHIPIHRQIELWENEFLEYYCCICYDDMMKTEVRTLTKESLSPVDYEVVMLLEAHLKIILPVVENINYNTVGISIQHGRIVGLGLFKMGVVKVPEYFSELKYLKDLNLGWNNLEQFPEYILSLSRLEQLDLSGNKLDDLFQDLNHLKSLKEFDLSFNLFKEIPLAIATLPYLKTLKLFKNKITFI